MRLLKWWLQSLSGSPNWQRHGQYEVLGVSSARFTAAVDRICTLCLRSLLHKGACCYQEDFSPLLDHVAFLLNNSSSGTPSPTDHVSIKSWTWRSDYLTTSIYISLAFPYSLSPGQHSVGHLAKARPRGSEGSVLASSPIHPACLPVVLPEPHRLSERGWAEAAAAATTACTSSTILLPDVLKWEQSTPRPLGHWNQITSFLFQKEFFTWKQSEAQTSTNAQNLVSLRPLSCPFALQNPYFLLDLPQRSVSSD